MLVDFPHGNAPKELYKIDFLKEDLKKIYIY